MRNTPCVGRNDPTFRAVIESEPDRWIACEWPERPINGNNAAYIVGCARCKVVAIAEGVSCPSFRAEAGPRTRAEWGVPQFTTTGELLQAMAAAGDKDALLAIKRQEVLA